MQVVPSQRGLTSPSILYLACSCPSALAAFILSLFSPWRGDTKRHLPGRDKPILKMLGGGGGPDAPRLSFPSSLCHGLFLPGRMVLRWVQAPLAIQWRVYSCVSVCLFFSGSACVEEVQRIPSLQFTSQPDPWGTEGAAGFFWVFLNPQDVDK